MEKLKKRGYSLASGCALCGEAEETLKHLLIHGPMVWGLWAALLAILGVGWTCPFLIKELILGWKMFPIRKKNRK